jgi:nucleotide-binding universal stress UspA family protein
VKIANILVPTDFSVHSERAVEAAVFLAKEFRAQIHLLHSYSLPVAPVMAYDFGIPQDVWESVRVAATERLAKLRDQVAAEGLEVSAHATRAFPSEAIVEAAKKLQIDLIVMGTRGMTGLKHVLLGSVAERTLRTAPCPVLAVKDGE